jgi:hypothetical protein
MPGRWNFSDAFFSALATQQKVVLEKEQGAREQQRIDLSKRQVDEAHADQLVLQELQRQEIAQRKTAQDMQLEEQKQQTANTIATRDAQTAIRKLATDEADRNQRPLNLGEVRPEIMKWAKTYIKDGKISASDYRLAVSDWNTDIDNQNKALQNEFYRQYTGSKLTAEQRGLGNETNRLLADIPSGDEDPTKSRKSTSEKLPFIPNVLNKLAPGAGFLHQFAFGGRNPFDPSGVGDVANAAGSLLDMDIVNSTPPGGRKLNPREKVRFDALLNLAKPASGIKGAYTPQLDIELRDAERIVTETKPVAGSEEERYMNRLRKLRRLGNAEDQRLLDLDSQKQLNAALARTAQEQNKYDISKGQRPLE